MNTPLNKQLSGRCMCGKVRYVIEKPARGVWNCHCVRCRRWTGHFTAATSCRRDDLRLISDETLAWYHPVEHPDVAYGFCRECGSSLFWKVVAAPPDGPQEQLDNISVWAGTLDLPTGLSTERVIYAEDISDYHTPVPEMETLPRD